MNQPKFDWINTPSPKTNPLNIDYPTMGMSTRPLYSGERVHAGIANDQCGGYGGFIATGDKDRAARFGMVGYPPEAIKMFAEVAKKIPDSKMTIYGGAQQTTDSKGFAEAKMWAGVARDLDKNVTVGFKAERSVDRANTEPRASVSFWSLFKR